MAKGTSGRGSAHGTPSSLTSLLSPGVQTPLQAVAEVNAMWHQNQAFFDPNRPIGLRPYHPEWDNQTAKTISDRRRYDPIKTIRPAFTLGEFRDAARLVMHPTSVLPSFNIPNAVAVCLRRKTRREVILANKYKPRRGKGGGPRKYRRNFWSDVIC